MKETDKRLLVVDTYYLPSEYKETTLEALQEQLEKEYGCKVIFIDTSRQNIQGTLNNNLPIYYTE